MPAPRLLDKRTLNTELATQKKRQIDEGLALAKKVDALRDTLGEEEHRLETFRSSTLIRVQEEINAKIAERDVLERTNVLLREERIRLSTPIDLTQAWEDVKIRQNELETWQARLSEETIEVTAQKADLENLSKALEKDKLNTQKKDELSERTLQTAEERFTEAETTLTKAKEQAVNLLQDAKQRENHLRVREEDATQREYYLSKREKEVEAHEIDLSNREKKLRSRQELFIKAQNYIKRKK